MLYENATHEHHKTLQTKTKNTPTTKNKTDPILETHDIGMRQHDSGGGDTIEQHTADDDKTIFKDNKQNDIIILAPINKKKLSACNSRNIICYRQNITCKTGYSTERTPMSCKHVY